MIKLLEKIFNHNRNGFTLKSRFVKTNPAGFTLIELLIVIAIIAILVGIVVVTINPGRLVAEANDSKKRQEMQQLKNALQLYFNDFNDYPTVTEFLTPTPCGGGDCLTPVYIRELPEEFTAGTPTAIYDITPPVPPGEYRAGMGLSTYVTEGNDDGTDKLCGGQKSPSEIPTSGVWGSTDYFICPD